MKTLFIISLPRALSTLVYHVARLSLSLNEPTWTTDGEILNNDRYVHYNGKRDDSGSKYTRQETQPNPFKQLSDFLVQITQPQGFIYKDVVHPFVVSHSLKTMDVKVLKIKRPLPDVAYAMLKKQWYYPINAVDDYYGTPTPSNSEDSMLQGLILAEETIEQIPGETIHYDIFMEDELEITRALERLYPCENVIPMGYIDEEFCRERESVLERRDTEKYRQIEEKIKHLKYCHINPGNESSGLQEELKGRIR